MGLYQSKEFEAMLQEEFPAASTPELSKKFLDKAFDPRSPTAEITRTPIRVDKTPDFLFDPRSPTMGIVRTPLQVCQFQEVADPRSPTAGIDRTPIYSKHAKGRETELEPVPPLIDLLSEECEEKAAEEEGQQQATKTSQAETTELPSNAEQLMPEVEKVVPEPVQALPSTPKEDQSGLRKRRPKQLFLSDSEPISVFVDKENPGSPAKLKDASPKVKESGSRSPLKALDNSPRSQKLKEGGLKGSDGGARKKTIDVNSPRVIMQRKQTTKLNSKLAVGCALSASLQSPAQGQRRANARSRSPARGGSFAVYEDKENA